MGVLSKFCLLTAAQCHASTLRLDAAKELSLVQAKSKSLAQAKSDTLAGVIKLMGEMVTDLDKDVNRMEGQWATHKTMCEKENENLEADLKRYGEEINASNGRINEAQVNIDKSNKEIKELTVSNEKNRKDRQIMENHRNAQNEMYTTKRMDIEDGIFACEEATHALSEPGAFAAAGPTNAQYDGNKPLGLVQVHKMQKAVDMVMGKINKKKTHHLDTLKEIMEHAQIVLRQAPPQQTDYAVGSSLGKILDMIAELKDQLKSELSEATEKENALNQVWALSSEKLLRNHDFDAEKLDSTNEFLDQQTQVKTDELAKLAELNNLNAATKETHEHTNASCSKSAYDFVDTMKAHHNEMDALNQARQILSGGAVNDTGDYRGQASQSSQAHASTDADGNLVESGVGRGTNSEEHAAKVEAARAARNAAASKSDRSKREEFDRKDRAATAQDALEMEATSSANDGAEVGALQFLQISSTSKRSGFSDPRVVKVTSFLEGKAKTNRLAAEAIRKIHFKKEDGSTGDIFNYIKSVIADKLYVIATESEDDQADANNCGHLMKKSVEDILHAETRFKKFNASVEILTGLLSEDQAQLKFEKESLEFAKQELSAAQELRALETEGNLYTIQEQKAAVQAIGDAVIVLKEFYDDEKVARETKYDPSLYHDGNGIKSPVTGGTDPVKTASDVGTRGGVVVMLTNIRNEIEADTEAMIAQESEEQARFEEFRGDNKKFIAMTEANVGTLEGNVGKKGKHLSQETEKFEAEKIQLGKLQDYRDHQLNPLCVDSGVSFGDRTYRRYHEIEDMQKALKILNEIPTGGAQEGTQ